ncbi:aminotransferase class V-fold PLP-dependent enzyme [Kutzneria buriramensis]|uniref:Selenocysteine lyase/cysteine desulfurase n=1 Tax=Kutzneria buriramensis TaxID=1045776 RepID=A0A3E0I0I1_9PSEU|nr:aminotransferase class V-fold PLP-dependent enzyme [Kutzneria buriramensis]REH52203.1 selenocysteine lyase/cysteine desulfurase [Kutzneria buriramensis]
MREAFGQTFDIPAGYLNTASIGVPPTVAADAVEAAVRRWRLGADVPPGFDADVAAARAAFAALVGVDAAQVAIGASASQLIALAAASVPDGARVLVPDGEFTSTTFPFAALGHRGIKVTEVPLAEVPDAMRDHDVLAASVVQSSDGAVLDLDAVRRNRAGVTVVLDATQALGWLPADLAWADYVVAAGYKWLMTPRGAAWMALHPDVLDRTLPLVANWYAGEDPWQTVYGLPLRLAGDARRLDLSPAWFSHVGAAAVLPWLASLDVEAVRRHNVGLANLFLDRLGLPPGESAIVSVDANATRLAQAGVRHSVRAGRVRLSFALNNTVDDVELAVRSLLR